MNIAAYIRISTDDQDEDRQMRTIREKYVDPEQDNQIWQFTIDDARIKLRQLYPVELEEDSQDHN